MPNIGGSITAVGDTQRSQRQELPLNGARALASLAGKVPDARPDARSIVMRVVRASQSHQQVTTTRRVVLPHHAHDLDAHDCDWLGSVGGQHASDLRGAEVHPSPNLEACSVDLGSPLVGGTQTDPQALGRSVQDLGQLSQAQQRAVAFQ